MQMEFFFCSLCLFYVPQSPEPWVPTTTKVSVSLLLTFRTFSVPSLWSSENHGVDSAFTARRSTTDKANVERQHGKTVTEKSFQGETVFRCFKALLGVFLDHSTSRSIHLSHLSSPYNCMIHLFSTFRLQLWPLISRHMTLTSYVSCLLESKTWALIWIKPCGSPTSWHLQFFQTIELPGWSRPSTD